MEGIFFVLIIIIALAVVVRLLAGSFDGERVERYIRDMGCELIDKSWDPFVSGWFGEKDSRISILESITAVELSTGQNQPQKAQPSQNHL